MLSITKEFLFDAAHTLERRDLSQEENQALYGKCSRFHGHTYRLQITVSGDVGADGMIINFSRLKDLVKAAVVDRYDHAFLNDLEEYEDLPPTAENMVQHIFRVLDPVVAKMAVRLESVVLYETPTSWATMTR
mgnify:CR=1 FL=1